MKIAYVKTTSFDSDSRRTHLLLDSHDYLKVDRRFFYFILMHRPTHLYIEDDISFFDSIRILVLVKTGFIRRLVLRSLELYRIDFKALMSEFHYFVPYKEGLIGSMYSWLRLIGVLRKVAKVYVLRKICKHMNSVLILSSVMRKEYLNDQRLCKEILVLRNLPLDEDMCTGILPILNWSEDVLRIISSGKFYLMSGRINALDDFNAFANRCKLNGDNLLIAGVGEELGNLLERQFCGVVKYIGTVSHDVIVYLVKNSRGGLVLYNNVTINQKFSASSKLFEYLYFGKPVFVSDNVGVKEELARSKYPYFEIIDGVIFERCNSQKELNEHGLFSFNRELEIEYNNLKKAI